MMGNQRPIANPCEVAALRIQHWFGKDRVNLLCLYNLSLQPQDFCKKYKCDLLKPFCIPSQVRQLPLQGYILSKKKKQSKQRLMTQGGTSKPLRFVIDTSQCSVNQANWNHIAPGNALSLRKIAAYCRVKEHRVVFKKLKIISKQPRYGQPKGHQIDSLQLKKGEDLSGA